MYKSDCNRMLAGSGSVPATGWMSVGEKFRAIAQSKQVFLTCSKYLTKINFRVSKFSARSTVMQYCPEKASKMSGIVLHIQIPGWLASMHGHAVTIYVLQKYHLTMQF